jgi:hypothetical protein
MRVFIGFKWRSSDGDLRSIPVMYGDMTRQVANIIRENSENKMPTVPRIACYITGLELDTKRISDSSFVSKVNIRERDYHIDENGQRVYNTKQGANYTVERLMPTPYMLDMKADIWTSNTDQKLQIFEQIGYLFNPTLEIQSTDNFLDWTSITTLSIKSLQFSSRSVPQGIDAEIDVLSMTFEIPIWISPPAKVKKLGVIQTIISNIFTEEGNVVELKNLTYNDDSKTADAISSITNFSVLVLKSPNGNTYDYNVSVINQSQAALEFEINVRNFTLDRDNNWNNILESIGGYRPDSTIRFRQPNNFEIIGTFIIDPFDPTLLIVTVDQDTIPTNTLIASPVAGLSARGTVDAIVDPKNFNPVDLGQRTVGARFLMLENVNSSQQVGDSSYSGPLAWKNIDGSDPVIAALSIVEWSGSHWNTVFDPQTTTTTYIQNIRSGIQYVWDGSQWIKSFEGEYRVGSWYFSKN